jgi:hypothetical protein
VCVWETEKARKRGREGESDRERERNYRSPTLWNNHLKRGSMPPKFGTTIVCIVCLSDGLSQYIMKISEHYCHTETNFSPLLPSLLGKEWLGHAASINLQEALRGPMSQQD